MTSGLETYLEALSETKKLIEPPEGLSKYNASSLADGVIIKQNNTIIQMMIQMYNKIDQIEKRIKLLEEEKESENKIDELIYKINRLTLDDNIKKLKTPDKEMIFGTI